MISKNKPIAIIGAGNGGQAFAGWLSLRGYQVRIFDVVPATVNRLNELGCIEIEGRADHIGKGTIQFASTDMGKVMDGCELILVILPSIYHKSIATEMSKHLVDGQTVLLSPNACLGLIEYRKTLNDCNCTADITLGAVCNLLFSCRAPEIGRVIIAGQKETLKATTLPSCKNEEMQEKMNEIFPAFHFDSDIIRVSLDNMNAFMHPAPTLLNTGRIEGGIDFEYYRDMTPSQCKFIEALDKERCAIAEAFGIDLPTIVEEYLEIYDTSGSTIYEVLTQNNDYIGIKGPTSLHIRYLQEDIPYSLEAIVALGEMAGVPTPCTRAIITVARAILGDELAEGRTAKNLGIENMTKEEFLAYCRG